MKGNIISSITGVLFAALIGLSFVDRPAKPANESANELFIEKARHSKVERILNDIEIICNKSGGEFLLVSHFNATTIIIAPVDAKKWSDVYKKELYDKIYQKVLQGHEYFMLFNIASVTNKRERLI